MFGTLRLILAAMVVFSHMTGHPAKLEVGVLAVAIFFLISGYAMTGLIQKRFSHPDDAPYFYLERIVRLAPQYYFWLLIALVVEVLLAWYPLNMSGFIPYGLFAYLTVIPLGLQGYLGPVDTWVIPQASTLAIEITFYLLAPLLIRNRWLSLGLGLSCLGLFIATQHGLLPPALYTYNSSPGPLPLFLLGSYLYRKDWLLLAILTVATVLTLLAGLSGPANKELLIGIVCGLPVIALLARLRPSYWDTALGNASYGCYLSHIMIFIVLKHLLGEPMGIYSIEFRLAAVSLACLAGYMGYILVEKPTVSYRRRLKSGGPVSSGPHHLSGADRDPSSMMRTG